MGCLRGVLGLADQRRGREPSGDGLGRRGRPGEGVQGVEPLPLWESGNGLSGFSDRLERLAGMEAALEALQLNRLREQSALELSQASYLRQKEETELALAMSLSLAQSEGRSVPDLPEAPLSPSLADFTGGGAWRGGGPGAWSAGAGELWGVPADGAAEEPGMSYEELVGLEDVKVPASAEAIAALPTREAAGAEVQELCSICQCDYDEERVRTTLPCGHHFHQACATEWLGTYSKLCPVCKTCAVD